MARATVYVAGRRYDIACHEGEEARFEALAGLVDQKARVAVQGLGGVNEARQLLLAALLLADDLQRVRADGLAPGSPEIAPALGALAERIEALASRLEKPAPTP